MFFALSEAGAHCSNFRRSAPFRVSDGISVGVRISVRVKVGVFGFVPASAYHLELDFHIWRWIAIWGDTP